MQKLSVGRFPLATTRMRGISDLLANLYGEEEFIFALMDGGEELEENKRRLTQLYREFARFQLRHIPDFYGHMGSFYYHCIVPYGTVWHQEDSASLLSPQLYEEHVLPYDRQICESFAGNIIHQHSVGYVPTESFLKLPLTAMEMHLDEGGASAEELAEKHRLIQNKLPLIIWGTLKEGDLEYIWKNLQNHVTLIAYVKNAKEAQSILRQADALEKQR